MGDRGCHEELEIWGVDVTDYWKKKEAVVEFERYWNKDNMNSLLRRWGLVERLAKKPLYSSLLDIGCGLGNLIAFTSLSNKNNYYGIDISPPMVERAKVLHPEFRFEVADPMGLDGKWDLVVAHGLLLHQHDPFPMLRKLVKLTGSCLIFDVLVTREGYSRRSPNGYWTRVLGKEEYEFMKSGLRKDFRLEEREFGRWGDNIEYYLKCERRLGGS